MSTSSSSIFKRLLLLLIVAVACVTAGYWIGQTGPANDPKTVSPKHAAALIRSGQLPEFAGTGAADRRAPHPAPTAASPGSAPDIYRLPKAVWDHFRDRLYSDRDVPNEDLPEEFGVPEEFRESVILIIRNAQDLMNELELKHSTMEKLRNGDVKFTIAAYPREAANVRDELREAIRSQLAGIDDDRAEVLGDAVVQHRIFRVTGAEERSLMGREVPLDDGRKIWRPLQLIGRSLAGGVHGMFMEPVDWEEPQQRLNVLMARHFPSR